MPTAFRFNDLVAKFNDTLANPGRRKLYEDLKSLRLLGEVFTSNEQKTIRPYLFDTDDDEHWFERSLFEAHNNDELEEARVHRFFNYLTSGWKIENLAATFDRKMRAFLISLREMDYRVDLVKRSEGMNSLSLGYLPCSFECLKKICEAFPGSLTIECLGRVTEQEFKAKKIRNPNAKILSAFIAEQLTKEEKTKLKAATKLEIAEAAGQAVLL